jgi:RNA 2',3'-cyclic 3'-phosphodiesterase
MRLFVAIDIPEEIREKLWKAAKDFGIRGVVLSKRDQYHVSLQFLGETEESKLLSIREALSTVKQKDFGVKIAGITSFDQTLNVIFADIKGGSEEIKSIYASIDSELAKRGIAYKKENAFKPHVTLARVKFLRDKTLLLPIMAKYSVSEFGKFQARSIILKVSKPTPEGYAYEDLQEVKLERS